MTTRVAADEIRIFPPAPGQSMQWHVIGDSVMGGVSSGSARRDAEGNLVFEGTISLERNGGFASVRSAPAAIGARHAVAVSPRGDTVAPLQLAERAHVVGMVVREKDALEAPALREELVEKPPETRLLARIDG